MSLRHALRRCARRRLSAVALGVLLPFGAGCTTSPKCAAVPPASTAIAETAKTGATNDAAYRKLDTIATIVRKRNAESYAIQSPKGIDEASYVSVGGIEQWVTIRGENRANPV